MSDVKWIKIVTDLFDDEKIRLIEMEQRADSILVIWFKLLCLAGKCNNGGVFLTSGEMPYTKKVFANLFHRSPVVIERAFKIFEQFGMIEYDSDTVVIRNWEKYQSVDKLDKIKEQSRIRSAQYRKSKKEKKQLESVTHHVTVTPLVTQNHATEKEEELELELELEAVASSASDNDDRDKLKFLGGSLGKGVVLLSDNQFEDLVERLGLDEFNFYVEKLADFIVKNGAKVKSHYATILKWVEQDKALIINS